MFSNKLGYKVNNISLGKTVSVSHWYKTWLFEMSSDALIAEWLRHQTCNHKDAGSTTG